MYHGRRAASIENQELRVTVLEGGGHIAEIFDKDSGVNPLWLPGWIAEYRLRWIAGAKAGRHSGHRPTTNLDKKIRIPQCSRVRS